MSGDVEIGPGCRLGAYAVFTGPARIGRDNVFGPHTVIGADPQDRKFQGGGKLKIGDGNVFREFVSVHRGHLTDHGTVIGSNNWFLASSHVGHDCHIGDGNFITNGVLLAGHVEVGDRANISGLAAFHQFCRVGSDCMVSGHAAVRRDLYPFSMVYGDPAAHIGVNRVGLARQGWTREQLMELKEAFRLLRGGLAEQGRGNRYLEALIEFRARSQRGMAGFGTRKGRE